MASVFLENPNWVKLMEGDFDRLDKNNDNLLSLEDFLLPIDNVEKLLKPAPALVKNLREVACQYAEESFGLRPGVQLTKEQYVQRAAEYASLTQAKHDKGEEILNRKLQHAWFDIVDTTQDGNISMEAYANMLKAYDLGPDVAKLVFDAIDPKHDGKVKRQMLIDHNHKCWFTVEC